MLTDKVFEFALQLYAPDHHPLQATANQRFRPGQSVIRTMRADPELRGAP
jgi:hypothetical protein